MIFVDYIVISGEQVGEHLELEVFPGEESNEGYMKEDYRGTR